MQQSVQNFGQAHAGQLQQTEAMEALELAGQCLARPSVSLHCLVYLCIASAAVLLQHKLHICTMVLVLALHQNARQVTAVMAQLCVALPVPFVQSACSD